MILLHCGIFLKISDIITNVEISWAWISPSSWLCNYPTEFHLRDLDKSSVENKQFLVACMLLVTEDLFQRKSHSDFDFYVEEGTTHPLGDERSGQRCLWCSHADPRLHWLA